MMILRLSVFTLFALFLFTPALAQDGEGSLLPEINPQDIEIRSEFQARFPGLRRQPILGFNPKPRVYQIDPDRMPFMETREEAVAGIEVTDLDRPQPPNREIMMNPERMNALVRAGFGSYTTPELNAYGVQKLNENSLLSANLNYRSSDGHLDNQRDEFRYIDLQAQYLQKLNDDWQVKVKAGALGDQYHLNPLDENPERSNKGVSAEVAIQQINNAFSGMDFILGGSIFNSLEYGEINEKTYYAEVRKYWPGNRMYETFDVSASVEGGNYDILNADGESWMHAKAALQYERLLNFTTRISGKGGIDYVSDPFSEKVYFVPEVEVKHNINNNLSVTTNFYAKPEMQTVQEHHRQNRFLNNFTQLRHAYKIGFNAEASYSVLEGNSIYGGFSYDHVDNYAFYQREVVASELGLYEVNYGEANIFELYAGVAHQLVPEKFWVDAKFYGRNPSLVDGGDIPYEERLGLEGAISYKPFDKLMINGWAEYIGKREDPAAEGDLNAFLLLNGGVEYQINERFGVYAKVLNILGQEYEIWNGYQERPFQVFGGLTFKI